MEADYKTRFRTELVGPFWDRKQVLILQVLDENCRDYAGADISVWRDATIADLTEEK